MDETGSETDIKSVKEALRGQQHLLQKLYLELDKEREASSTAASEALSMILRLQEEKAAVKMEASQYQRMAEEKISHVEDSLASFEDVIYHKELEITSLEFQVHAYRYKLLSLGCSDLGPCEYRFADNLLLQRNDLGLKGENEIGLNGKVRRMKSLPLPIQLEDSYSLKDKLGYSNHCSYLDQIKMLDEQVKEISDSKGFSEEISEHLKLNDEIIVYEQTRQEKNTEQIEPKPLETINCLTSSRIQDIFEIPEAEQNLKACEAKDRLMKKLVFEDENRLRKPDSVSSQPSELQNNDERDETKAKKPCNCKIHKNKSSKSRKGKAVDEEIVVESQPLQQLCRRIDRLERERNDTRQEISEAGVEEELRLLKEIQIQLNSIQSEMRSIKRKPPSPPVDTMVDILQEAMLYFWC